MMNLPQLELIREYQPAAQFADVAFLPGIHHSSLAIPDICRGYSFYMGDVCETDPNQGRLRCSQIFG